MQNPNVFSEWITWERFLEKKSLDERFNHPGVYLLAQFRNPPKNLATGKESEIVYIGETTRQELKTRLMQFQRSAFQGRGGHSGGHTYKRHLGEGSLPIGTLFVAVNPVPKSTHSASAFLIKYFERRLLWEFIEISKDNAPPLCNRL